MEVLGAVDRPSIGAGAVAAVVAVNLASGDLDGAGSGGLAELADPVPILGELVRRGIRAAVFEGSSLV